MPTYAQVRMCNECPFRADAPRGWLGPLTIEDLEDAVHGVRLPGTTCHVGDVGELICHKDISKLMALGMDEDEISAEGRQCVGMMRYANGVCKLAHDPEVAEYQRRLRDVPDEPVIAPFKLREHHKKPLLKGAGDVAIANGRDACNNPSATPRPVGAAMSDKLVARVREMRKVLRQVQPKLKGKLRREVDNALRKSDKCVPPDNRIGKQLKFSEQTVKQAVEQSNGSKSEAAKLLGCSLRTIYTVLERGDPKPKPTSRNRVKVDDDALRECARMLVAVAHSVIPKLRGPSRSMLSAAADRCEDRLPSDRQPMCSVAEVRQALKESKGDKVAAAERLGCSLSTIYATLRRKDKR